MLFRFFVTTSSRSETFVNVALCCRSLAVTRKIASSAEARKDSTNHPFLYISDRNSLLVRSHLEESFHKDFQGSMEDHLKEDTPSTQLTRAASAKEPRNQTNKKLKTARHDNQPVSAHSNGTSPEMRPYSEPPISNYTTLRSLSKRRRKCLRHAMEIWCGSLELWIWRWSGDYCKCTRFWAKDEHHITMNICSADEKIFSEIWRWILMRIWEW